MTNLIEVEALLMEEFHCRLVTCKVRDLVVHGKDPICLKITSACQLHDLFHCTTDCLVVLKM